MPPSLPESGVAGTFIDAAREVLAEGMAKIEHCVNQLDDAGVWWRPAEGQNSIANLMLHLSGNVRQWIIAGVGGAAPDVRDRPREFADRSGRPKAEILGLLRRTVAEADGVLSRLTGDGLTQPRRIQGFETNVLAAVFDTIAHFRGHTQEIIHMTRDRLGEQYVFYFVPQGPEQTSAGADKKRPLPSASLGFLGVLAFVPG
ncbi:MAG TPA: DUF1572 family protein [Tepidisphaeraceae bacterium]|nr:DUF1572 family protein [Tepidisphaeraceae bacterium]